MCQGGGGDIGVVLVGVLVACGVRQESANISNGDSARTGGGVEKWRAAVDSLAPRESIGGAGATEEVSPEPDSGPVCRIEPATKKGGGGGYL